MSEHETSDRPTYNVPADEVARWVAGDRVSVAGTTCRVVDVVAGPGPDGTPGAIVRPVEPAGRALTGELWTVHGVRWVIGARWVDSGTAARELATYEGAGTDTRRYDLDHEPAGWAVVVHGAGVRYVSTGAPVERWTGRDGARVVRVDVVPGTFYPANTSAELAGVIGCTDPDTYDHRGDPGSPGAAWLRTVERAYPANVAEYHGADSLADLSDDEVREALDYVAGDVVPESSWATWRIWTDLGAWQMVEMSDAGPVVDGMPLPTDPSEMAGAVLVEMARTLLLALHEHAGHAGDPVDGCKLCTAARLTGERVAREQRDGTAYVGTDEPAS